MVAQKNSKEIIHNNWCINNFLKLRQLYLSLSQGFYFNNFKINVVLLKTRVFFQFFIIIDFFIIGLNAGRIYCRTFIAYLFSFNFNGS